MPEFNLSEDTVIRLRAKFGEFQQERGRLHGLLTDYVAEYRQFQGTPQERREYMEGQFSGRALTMSHLLLDVDGAVYWHVRDMTILLGRNQSTLSRTLSAMERSDGWCSRLLSLRKEAKSANGNTIYVYRQEIFDLILDHYEEEYLLRFAEPRRGDRDKAPDINEVRRFWQYLKDSAQIQQDRFIRQEEQMALPALPPMGWKDVLSLIWSKVFTVRTTTLTSVAVAAAFWLARRFPAAAPWFTAASAFVLLFCAALLRLRRGTASLLSGAGAGALLFGMLWGAGLLSSDGVIHTSDGPALNLQGTELTMDVKPEFFKAGYYKKPEISFKLVPSDYHNLKEVFYRLDSEGEYHSTGFNDYQYPNLGIDTERTEGTITLEIKCLDASG
ncbi:MAG: CvpA family protein, partial [Fretibacterium sp.]|nr:CvpA family protein [Fretibacterium sp.]